ncbi:MAG: hypothetical protein CSA45_04535 [Gammaproteobacteria bacterium]|nr:MAG: hypothetical protein CSA45_04535 [Gammaproteobacteria bacterium]
MTKKRLSLLFLVVALAVGALSGRYVAFFFGVAVSLFNFGLHFGVYLIQRKQVPRYPAQALVAVVSTTVFRFVVCGCLLVLGFHRLGLAPNPLLLGFILGQLFFLFYQLTTVATNDVK